MTFGLWYFAIPSFILFVVNLILFFVLIKKTKHKHGIFIVGVILTLYGIGMSIAGTAIYAQNNKRPDGYYYLKVMNPELGGQYSAYAGWEDSRTSTYTKYLVQEGDRISVSEWPYAGYEFSFSEFIKTDDNSSVDLELFQGGANWWEYIMPAYDVTIIPHFSYKGYEVFFTWETDYGYASISWSDMNSHKVISEGSDWTLYSVDIGTNFGISASPKSGYTFDYWSISTQDCYNNYSEESYFGSSFTYNMPEADVHIYPVFH